MHAAVCAAHKKRVPSMTYEHGMRLKLAANTLGHKAKTFLMSIKLWRGVTADDPRPDCNNDPDGNPSARYLPDAPLKQMMDFLHAAKTSHYRTICTHLVGESAED